MIGWILVLVVVSIGIFIFLLILLIHRFCFQHAKQPIQTSTTPSLQNEIAKLHHVTTLHHNQNNNTINQKRTNYYVFRQTISAKPLFNWADNPSLVTDAVENGWSRFAFTTYTSSPSVRSARSILGACADGGGTETEVEISWEVCQGSSDFMQKIRFNSGLKKRIITSTNCSSVIKSALPLPGPPLANSWAFPQEAYFEITILGNEDDDLVGKVVKVINKAEGEKIKLIQESPSEKSKLESLIHVASSNYSHPGGKFEDLKVRRGDDDGETVVLSVGLTAGGGGGSMPLKLPGSYPGSIGFNSNGSVYLDGIKLVFESESDEWGKTDKVIGCGYNPSKKKVFFTVDSELVHEIHCKSEEFGTPLYPTLAANSDIMVLVNFGQSVFKYAPANLQRTPNPCFIGPLANSPSLGYEDSKELFSMGRIDSQWLNRSTTRTSTQYNGSVNKGGVDYDEALEGDLFEIVLDSFGRSPHTPL